MKAHQSRLNSRLKLVSFFLFTKDEMLVSGSGKEIDEGFRIGRQNDLNQNYQEETEKLRSTSSGGKL